MSAAAPPKVAALTATPALLSFLGEYHEGDKTALGMLDGTLIELTGLNEAQYLALTLQVTFKNQFPLAAFVSIEPHDLEGLRFSPAHFALMTAPQRHFLTRVHWFQGISGGQQIVFYGHNPAAIKTAHEALTARMIK